MLAQAAPIGPATCAVLRCAVVYACRSQISTYDASRLKVQQLPHLQESPASQQVGPLHEGGALK